MSRNVMGRGLGALLDSVGPSVETSGVRELPLDLLHANPSQPRVDFDEEALEGLAESIRANGVIQPLVVRPMGEAYQVVTGERRLRAARRAGIASVPVVVRHDLGEQDVLFLGLIENLQREDLNPVEEARSMEQLAGTTGLTHDQIAKRIGKSRVHVTNTLRLLKLPEELLGWLRGGRLSAGHARALLGLDLPEQMLMLAERVVEEGWSVRKLEAYVKEYARQRDEGDEPPRQRPLPKLFRKAAASLQQVLGTRVAIRQVPGKKGRISIEFEHKKDLKRILSRFQGLGIADEDDED
jgi:ParB family chromosome partitioning protein